MIIMHCSDNHGSFNKLPYGRFDVLVHSGDLMPDQQYYKNKRISNYEFHKNWLKENANKIKGWCGGRPFLFVLGNHDWIDGGTAELILQNEEVNAHCLHNTIVNIDDVKFYGFPYVPYINGCWANEKTDKEMRKEVDRMCKDIKGQHIDILVAHSPPYGMLDQTQSRVKIGNRFMVDYLTYKVAREDLPSWYLCGHVHASNGVCSEYIVNISNAATTCNKIEIH